MKPVDKTEQALLQKFDYLGRSETDVNKRDIREARRKIKQQIHKHQRRAGKQQLKKALEGNEDE